MNILQNSLLTLVHVIDPLGEQMNSLTLCKSSRFGLTEKRPTNKWLEVITFTAPGA